LREPILATYEVVLSQTRQMVLTVEAESTQAAEDLALDLAQSGDDLGTTLEESFEVEDSELVEDADDDLLDDDEAIEED
jgi:hypothetical protein